MSGPNSSPASSGSADTNGEPAAGITRADHPPVFLSATSADLGGVRRAAKEALLALGYYPVEQSHFGPAPGETLERLDEEKILRSAAVIHIVGECHGADPEEPHPARSYTQREYDVALRHGKPLYLFVCRDGFPYTPHEPESDLKRQLQLCHREHIFTDHRQYISVASPEDLLRRLGQIELRLQRVETHAQRAADEAQGARAAAEQAAPAAWWAKKSVYLALLIIPALVVVIVQQCNGRREAEQGRRKAEQDSSDAEHRDQVNTDLLRRALRFSEQIEEKAFARSGPGQGGDSAARLRTAQIDTAEAAGITLDELIQTLGNAKKQSIQSENKDLSTARLALASGDNTAAEAAANRYLAQQDAERREALILRGNAQLAAIKYPEAEASYRAACTLVDRHDAETWALTHSYLAQVLDERGAYAESLALWRKILPILEKKYGQDSIEAMAPTSWIAMELWRLSQFEEAEKYFRRALEIDEKALGPAHPDIATNCNNLSLVLNSRGDFEEAELYLRKALKIDEKALGPAHSHVARDLASLGNVLNSKGHIEEAELNLHRALEIDEKALGPAHPAVGTICGKLGSVLRTAYLFTEAEHYYRRALQIHERALGPVHPDVAIDRYRLGDAIWKSEQQEEAGHLLREAIAGLETQGNYNQRYLAAARWRLAQWHKHNRQTGEAHAEGARALDIATKTFGPDDPQTKNIKEWLDALGR